MSKDDSRGFEAVLEKLQGGVDGYRERIEESFGKMGPELARSTGVECFVWLTLVADHLGIKDGDDPGSLGYACLRAIDAKLGTSNSTGVAIETRWADVQAILQEAKEALDRWGEDTEAEDAYDNVRDASVAVTAALHSMSMEAPSPLADPTDAGDRVAASSAPVLWAMATALDELAGVVAVMQSDCDFPYLVHKLKKASAAATKIADEISGRASRSTEASRDQDGEG